MPGAGTRSGYYRWIAGAEARAGRQFEEDALVEEIREIHAEHRGNYGALRVHAELRGFGHTVNRKRVARLMRKHGIAGRHLRKKKRTTIPDRLAPPVADLVPATSHTCRSEPRGSTSLASSISGRAECSAGRWPRTCGPSVIDALQAAVAPRGGDVTGVIFHADRGSQYTSAAFAQVCDLHGIRRSMGRVGSSYDNALAESFWQGLKRETTHRKVFVTMSQARLEIFRWLTYYNLQRPTPTQRALLPLPDGVRTAPPQDS